MHVFYILLDYICITGKYEDYLIMHHHSLQLLKALVIVFYENLIVLRGISW